MAGAPGGNGGAGSVFYYRWDPENEEWKTIFLLPGGRGESLGSTVAILDDDAFLIAFGGPTAGLNNEGVVRVYRDFGIAFFRQGGDIVGLEGEKIGTTLCGAKVNYFVLLAVSFLHFVLIISS